MGTLVHVRASYNCVDNLVTVRPLYKYMDSFVNVRPAMYRATFYTAGLKMAAQFAELYYQLLK